MGTFAWPDSVKQIISAMQLYLTLGPFAIFPWLFDFPYDELVQAFASQWFWSIIFTISFAYVILVCAHTFTGYAWLLEANTNTREKTNGNSSESVTSNGGL